MSEVPDVPARLEAAAELFRERNRAYGGNYTTFGKVATAIWPSGLSLQGPEELGRMVLVCHMITKLTRYARNMTTGGHKDSLEDLAVYAQMTAELDDLAAAAGLAATNSAGAVHVPASPPPRSYFTGTDRRVPRWVEPDEDILGIFGGNNEP